jgi:tetratricopeptide (TPR) repeat protein
MMSPSKLSIALIALLATANWSGGTLPAWSKPLTKVEVVNRKRLEPSPTDYKHLAIAHQSKGMLAKAIVEYEHAIQLNPKDAGNHNNLAMALKDLGIYSEAAKEERIALKLRPQQANYHYNLALILQHQADLRKAVSELKKAAVLNQTDSEIHYRMAQVQLERQKPQDAERELRTALQLTPNQTQYLRLLGDALMLQDRDEEALSAYNQVAHLTKKPDLDLRNKIEYLTQRNSTTDHL